MSRWGGGKFSALIAPWLTETSARGEVCTMKQSYVFIMFMHIVRAFFLDYWSQGIPLLHSPQYIRQVISSPWTPLFFLSVWAGELFRQGLSRSGHAPSLARGAQHHRL